MFKHSRAILLAAMLPALLAGCSGDKPESGSTTAESAATAAPATVSGRVEAGLRVLPLDPHADSAPDFVIYRGDYVRIEPLNGETLTIAVPELEVSKSFPVAEGDKAYFSAPRSGRFAYTVGGLSGTLDVIDYVAAGYEEVSAQEGAALIANIDPFILDVRTPGEFAEGHLAGATLVPVQVLQSELEQLMGYREKPVFVYCRSGNRSTVAAKLLVDNGFHHVVNLRHGIREWQQANLPIEN